MGCQGAARAHRRLRGALRARSPARAEPRAARDLALGRDHAGRGRARARRTAWVHSTRARRTRSSARSRAARTSRSPTRRGVGRRARRVRVAQHRRARVRARDAPRRCTARTARSPTCSASPRPATRLIERVATSSRADGAPTRARAAEGRAGARAQASAGGHRRRVPLAPARAAGVDNVFADLRAWSSRSARAAHGREPRRARRVAGAARRWPGSTPSGPRAPCGARWRAELRALLVATKHQFWQIGASTRPSTSSARS